MAPCTPDPPPTEAGWSRRPSAQNRSPRERATQMSISVLLTDDQPLLRRGFRMILEAEGDITVAAEASNGEEAIDLARRHAPGGGVREIRMPGPARIRAGRRGT